ncbi:MAG: hypothetical protein EON59_16070 [Alphaproteobacteria bacterium]|nr:MAG: hypothetical protein EON59_16070 [Alphaproteobacteria bacterium]
MLRRLRCALAVALGFSGCASLNSSNTRSLLSAAGFRERTPETAKQKELYAQAESYKLMRISAKGKTMYAYKDEKAGTALVGDESNYQQYEKLAVEQKIAAEQYRAAAIQADIASGWYGAYGYSVYGPPGIPYRYR